jgi:hypothetical protein
VCVSEHAGERVIPVICQRKGIGHVFAEIPGAKVWIDNSSLVPLTDKSQVGCDR